MSTGSRPMLVGRTPELSHVAASSNAPCGRVSAFLRFPSAVGRVQANFARMGVRLVPDARSLFDLLLENADAEGFSWKQITGELGVQLGIDIDRRGKDGKCIPARRVQVNARTLRGHGFISWTKIPAKSCYPGRDPDTGKMVLGAGEYTQYGGRLWRFHWAAFGVSFDTSGRVRSTSSPPPPAPRVPRSMPESPPRRLTTEEWGELRAGFEAAMVRGPARARSQQ